MIDVVRKRSGDLATALRMLADDLDRAGTRAIIRRFDFTAMPEAPLVADLSLLVGEGGCSMDTWMKFRDAFSSRT